MNGVARDEPHLVEDIERSLDDAATAPIWRRADVPRALLVKPTIARLIRRAVIEWVGLTSLWAVMALCPWWIDLPLMLLVAGRLHAFGVILHDATHMALRAKGPAVRLLEAMVGYPIATTLDAMRYHHLRHHRDSGMPSDPYFKAGVDERRLWLVHCLRGALLMPFWTVRAPFGVVAWLIPALRRPYARVFLQDRSPEDPSTSGEVFTCAREELGQVLFQVPLALAFVAWPDVLVWYYALPATVTGLLASYRVLCEHRYVATTDRKIETILGTTRDHHLRWWEQLFLAPLNIGFHVVHHIHPQVALGHLPALRAWYIERHGLAYSGERRSI